MLAFPGVPAIYIQSILGSRNDYAGVERLGYNRAINRQKYSLTEIEAQLNTEGSLRQRVYQQLTHLVAVRKSQAAFHPDSQFTLSSENDAVFAMERCSASGERILALFNLSNAIQAYPLSNYEFNELITGQVIKGDQLYQMQPYQVLWLHY